jgi:eukaryotic-like serine/threonine-protein kinase
MILLCPACQSPNEESAETCFTCGQALVATVGVGSVVANRYEIKAQLGRGGMGVVYQAHDRLLDETVAIKVLRPEVAHDPEISRRFQSEIKLARRVSHRNVCRIHEYGEDRGLRYISMEYLEGVDLRQILRGQQGGLVLEEAFAVCLQTAEGLQAIHDVGVIHRDLKTPNIMRDARGQVRLMDFGIAKEGGAAATSATATGLVMGTPEYMSPEQARGEKIDLRTDIYALGILIFEVFTGRVPFRAETPLATILKHLQEPPPLDAPEAAGLPEAVKHIIGKALAKNPQERFQTVEEVLGALRAARAEASGPAPTVAVPSRPVPAPPPAAPTTFVPPATPTVRAQPAGPAPTGRAAATRVAPPMPPPRRPTPPAPQRSSNVGLWVAVGGGAFLLLVVVAGVVLWRVVSQRPGPPSPAPTTLASLPEAPASTLPLPPPKADVPPPTTLAAAPSPTPVTPATVPATRPPATTLAPAPPVSTITLPPPPTVPAVPAEVAQLVDSLGDANTSTRWRSAEALGNLGGRAKPAVPALVSLLGDRDEVVRWRAAEALGKIGPDAQPAVEELGRAVKGSGLPATEAAKALGRIGPAASGAAPVLASVVASKDVYLRREAAKALARMGPGAAAAVPALMTALGDDDKVVRMESARALGRMGVKARVALEALAGATRDKDDLVRQVAAEAKAAIERAP